MEVPAHLDAVQGVLVSASFVQEPVQGVVQELAKVVGTIALVDVLLFVAVVLAHVAIHVEENVWERVQEAVVILVPAVLALVVVAAAVVVVEVAVAVLEVVRAARHAALVPIYALEVAADPATQDATMDVRHPAYRLVIAPVLNLVQVNLHHQLLSIKRRYKNEN